MRGSVRTTASVASTLTKVNTNSYPLGFDNARALHSAFGHQPRDGCPIRSMAVPSGIIIFTKLDSTVLLLKRGHGIEVRIRSHGSLENR